MGRFHMVKREEGEGEEVDEMGEPVTKKQTRDYDYKTMTPETAHLPKYNR